VAAPRAGECGGAGFFGKAVAEPPYSTVGWARRRSRTLRDSSGGCFALRDVREWAGAAQIAEAPRLFREEGFSLGDAPRACAHYLEKVACIEVVGYRQQRPKLFSLVVPRIVLVADDNPAIRKVMCRMFEEEADYDLCEQAENGKQAIELALKCKPDLIILDLSMPVMNGLDAARELKKLMPQVPIILFTQHADLGNRVELMSKDVDRIVAKSEAASLMGHVRQLAPAN
jgi:CheY-like chemotaxis protein